MKDLKEWVACISLFAMGLAFGSFYNIDLDVIDKDMIEVTGNDYYGFERLKRDCEKGGKSCVMIYEFVPNNTGEFQ